MSDKTIEYHIFRIKFINSNQENLFPIYPIPREMLIYGLNERPSKEIKKGSIWCIGNIENIEENGGRFAIGKVTKSKIERFDKTSGNFIEKPDDSSIYTYTYFDSNLGLLGIAKKPKLATINIIANRIQDLLKTTELVTSNNITVTISPIPDPDEFIDKIQKAHAVKKFKAHFTGPNPVDPDAIFQRPLSVYCQTINGNNGFVEVKGDTLDKETIQEVAKSTAAMGNNASAVIIVDKGLMSISLSKEAIKILLIHDLEKEKVLEEIRKAYKKVRT